jgi:DNA-binding transcriptional MerR regulator
VEEDFPQKNFYTIGEVCRLTGVKAHVLRYWETQGKLIKPQRRGSRHRLYRLSDIRLILEIKRLREEEKLSLEAMRRQLHPPPPALPAMSPAALAALGQEVADLLRDIRDELRDLKVTLDEDKEGA